ncbi:MAG: aldehyde oxidase, partial [Actinomyces sp.]
MSVGRSAPRRDARDKVTGAARYPADAVPADALVARVVFTDQPHARLVRLDVEPARRVEGVVAVFTAADVPVNEYGLTMFDQPVFVGLEHTGRSAVPCDVSRWEADHLALVVAETTEAAERGAEAIVAEWEPLPPVADVDAALAPGAPLVHPENGLASNVYQTYRIRRGDPDAALASAAAVVEATYELPYQEHAYLQPEAGVARIDDEGRVLVEIAGQWTHEDRDQIAHALDLDPDRVRVVYPAIGGAFGGREDTSLQIVLALAAWRLHQRGIDRPVASRWSREESIVGHHKRHRVRVRARWGADAEGRITGVVSEAWLDAGAYNYTSNKVLGNLHLGQAGPYRVPNARIDSHAVYTNAVPGGAFRGFGGPQAAFVAESQMNRLAEALGLDPVEIRRRNLLADGDLGITGSEMPPGVTIGAVVDRCAAEAARPAPPPAPLRPFATLPPRPAALRRGRGFACAYKNVGFSFGFPERCEAEVVLSGPPEADEPDRADVFHAGADVGQGAHQAILQMTAEAVGLPLEQVHGHFSDTATSGDAGSASASRLTF